MAQVTVTADAGPPPDYQASAEVDDAPYVEPTAMVYVNPDVQVIEDYDYPVFFTGGLYWRNDGGVWYSSSWHDRGWVNNYNPPVVVAHIDRPEGYVHYHANVNARVGEPGYRNTHVTAVVHPAGPPPPRNYTPSRPPAAYGHGPAVTNHPAGYGQAPTAVRPAGENKPEPYGGAAGKNEGVTHAPEPKPAGYGQAPTAVNHPGEEPKPAGYGQAPTAVNHPGSEPTKPAGYGQAPTAVNHPNEPGKPAGYGQAPTAVHPPAQQAPAKAPPPAYKAPPPPPKKKK